MAARWAGYGWHTFQDLEGTEQATIIAAYRIENRMRALEGRFDG